MASRTETYTTRIFLNAEEAKKQLEELTRKTGELRKAKTEAASAGDWKEFNKIKRELDQTVKEIDKMKASSQKVSDVLNNLGKSGIKQIKETMSAINRELSSGAIERGSEEWNFLNEQLLRCNEELKKIRSEGKAAADLSDKITSWGNKMLGIYTIATDVFDRIRGLADPYVAEFLKIDTAMTNVRKYTGQTMDEVRAMNETFKQMDTATSREELNALAGSAGRLGITSKEAIERDQRTGFRVYKWQCPVAFY